MRTFIEDFLQDPTQAIVKAQQISTASSWSDNIDENAIYGQISSPEFRLYEEIIFS